MKPGLLKRTTLLLPILGILLTALFVGLPQGQLDARPIPPHHALQPVPDKEYVLEAIHIATDEAARVVHRARRFHCRTRALPLTCSLQPGAAEEVRAANHTGLYVLRHAVIHEDIPTSSQYGYLFRLTPF